MHTSPAYLFVRKKHFNFVCFVAFQIAASNYFFPQWLQENQSPDWKLFYRFSDDRCHGSCFNRKPFYSTSSDTAALKYWTTNLSYELFLCNYSHELFLWIMMSNNSTCSQVSDPFLFVCYFFFWQICSKLQAPYCQVPVFHIVAPHIIISCKGRHQ